VASCNAHVIKYSYLKALKNWLKKQPIWDKL